MKDVKTEEKRKKSVEESGRRDTQSVKSYAKESVFLLYL